MKTDIKRTVRNIDAAGKPIGRLATEVVKFLQGKHRPDFEAHVDCGDFVEVRNAAKVKITGKKLEGKVYYHYSGYPGGMKRLQLKNVMEKNPADALRRAVKNMLPKNRLRQERMKRLTVHND